MEKNIRPPKKPYNESDKWKPAESMNFSGWFVDQTHEQEEEDQTEWIIKKYGN